MEMNLNKREKWMAAITMIILGCVFLFTVMIDPQLKKHQLFSSRLSQLQLDLTKAKGNLMIKDKIEKSYARIKPLIASQESQQQKISDFTRLLDQMYSKLDLKIRSVKILPVLDEKDYQKLSIRIEMSGFVRDFLKFVEAVEYHSEPIRIEQFDLTCQETNDAISISMIISKVVSEESGVIEPI